MLLEDEDKKYAKVCYRLALRYDVKLILAEITLHNFEKRKENTGSRFSLKHANAHVENKKYKAIQIWDSIS